MSQVDETQSFWFVPTSSMWRMDFEYRNKEPLAVMLNIDPSLGQEPLVQVGGEGRIPRREGLRGSP